MSKYRLLMIHPNTALPWLFEAAVGEGIDLVIIPRNRVFLSDLPLGVVEVLDIDAEDTDAVLAAHRKNNFDGIFTPYDPSVPLVAKLAELMALPGLPERVAQNARDKRKMRAAFAAGGCNSPRFVRVDSMSEILGLLDFKFPAVVKPADGYGSLGVIRVDQHSELSSAIERSYAARKLAVGANGGELGIVVEEYLDGPEYVVESLVVDGAVHILAIGDKGYPEGPYFEEGHYVAPAQLTEREEDAIVREVVLGHEALGITMGPTHTELRMCRGVRPFILELGARFGGSGVSHYIVKEVSGVDYAGEVLRMAVGLPPRNIDFTIPNGMASPVGIAANYIVQCGGYGRISEISGLSQIAADPQVDHVIQMLYSGATVRPYPHFSGHPAFVLSRHADRESVLELHERIDSTVSISYEAGS